MNLIYLIIEIILCYTTIIILYQKKQKEGLYLYAIVGLILSNIMVLKRTEILSLEIALGFTIYASIFITSNIIVQKYGPEEIKKLLLVLVGSIIVSTIIIFLATLINGNTSMSIMNETFDYTFQNLRIMLANSISILIILWFNAILYHQIRRVKNKIIISNILTSIIVSFMATIIFSFIAYLGLVNIKELSILILIRYLIILIIEIIGTIPIYIINKIK